MAYGEKDPRLDQTTALVVGMVLFVVLMTILSLSGNYRYTQETERKAMEAGYCQVKADNAAFSTYHWEKCK